MSIPPELDAAEPQMALGLIYQAIPAIIGEIEPIEKTQQANMGSGGRYNFRGVDSIYSSLNLLLAKHQVTIIPYVSAKEIAEYENAATGKKMFRVTMEVLFRLYAKDGSFVTACVSGEAMDSGDKATPKALSMAYKYMAFQVFCIPSGEKIDTEEEHPEVKATVRRVPPPGTQSGKRAEAPAPEGPPPPVDGDPGEGFGEREEGQFSPVFLGIQNRLLATPKGVPGFQMRLELSRDVGILVRDGKLSDEERRMLAQVAATRR